MMIFNDQDRSGGVTPERMSRSPEPFASLKGKLSEGEGSGSMGIEMLRCAQHDNVWITVIITRFPIIVTEWLKCPLNGLEAVDTMKVNWVMMSVIHT